MAVRGGGGVRDEGAGRGRRGEPGWGHAGAGACCSTKFFFPFEVTSVLLIVAAIGAMVLGAAPAPSRRHAGGVRRRDRPATRAPAPEGERVRTPIAYFLLLSGDPVLDRHGRGAGRGGTLCIMFMSVELQLNAGEPGAGRVRPHAGPAGRAGARLLLDGGGGRGGRGRAWRSSCAVPAAPQRERGRREAAQVVATAIPGDRSRSDLDRHAARVVDPRDPARGQRREPVPRQASGSGFRRAGLDVPAGVRSSCPA